MKMLCRLNGIGPPDSKDIAVPLATVILDDSKMDLNRKLNITQKLFALATFVLCRILPSTATQIMALRETPTIGLINRS